jgi:pimeloyl-ACP methyl ester carboxylesterase
MNREEIILSRARLLLECPESNTSRFVLFLPGISGKAFSSRFDPLAHVVVEQGFKIARLSAWEDESEVHTMSLADLHVILTEALAVLTERGATEVIGIGKSFGGGVLLSFEDSLLARKILWAPAIGISESGNLEQVLSQELGSISQLLDIKLSAERLAHTDTHIAIIHGDADTVMPLLNSEEIVAAAHGRLTIIPGADHSFKSPEAEAGLLQATKYFLAS